MRDAKCRQPKWYLRVLRERGRKGLPCKQLYRQMFNKNLYLLAYGNIYSNQGAMTPGASEETADGMSEEKIEQITEAMRGEQYRFAPVRRVYIPKKNGKLRPLGCRHGPTSSSAKWCACCWRRTTSRSSRTARMGSGKGGDAIPHCGKCSNTWTGTVWFVEGDISDCFGSLDHEILLKILAEKIHDNRFLRLIRNMLKAGYLEDWEYHETLSGIPQGGVVSPILSNIYLDKLDKFVEQELIPQYTQGNPPEGQSAVQQDWHARRQAARQERGPGSSPGPGKADARPPLRRPDGPRLPAAKYARYADDHILGFIGPKAEAEEIKAKLAAFLRETLGLELNHAQDPDHPRPQPARRGSSAIDISVQHCNTKITNGRRSVNGKIALRVPPDVITAQCARYRNHGKPWHRSPAPEPATTTTSSGPTEPNTAGVVNYYLLAQDVWRLHTLRWNAETSMLKTLGAKHQSTVTKMAARYKAKVETGDGPRTCFEARRKREGKPDLVARFGGIPLRQRPAGGHP